MTDQKIFPNFLKKSLFTNFIRSKYKTIINRDHLAMSKYPENIDP